MEENRTDIYPGMWRVMGMIIVCALFVIGSFLMVNSSELDAMRYIGYVGIPFFSFGVFVFCGWLVLCFMKMPLAKIYDDRLEFLNPAKMRYEVIPFYDVESFAIIKTGAKNIRAEYLTGGERTTGISAILVPRIDKIADLLDSKLDAFWQGVEEPLDKTTVTCRLKAMGIKSWQFDFDTTSKTDCMVVIRDGDGFELVYVDDRGLRNSKGFYPTENEACHALLENFIEERVFKLKHGIN